MKVKELIKELEDWPEECEVLVADPHEQESLPVGSTHYVAELNSVVIFTE